MRLTDYQIRMYLADTQKLGSKAVAGSRKEAEQMAGAAKKKQADLESWFVSRVIDG